MNTRRTFFRQSAALLGAAALKPFAPLFGQAASSSPEINVFTKHFLGLSYERLAEVLAGLGITSIEAPIRPGGHLEPATVAEELPKFVEVLKRYGIRIGVLTSGINSVDKATHTELVLRTAKQLGIERYRMNFYFYDNKKPIWPQLDEIRPRLKDLVALSKEIGILPCYQNHSGAKFVGAGIWDIAMLMRDYRPDELSWCFDIMHATIEGSTSWPTEVALVSNQIGVAYFKNFVWEGKSHRTAPLAEGVVGKPYVDQVKKLGFRGPLSLHVEYLKGGVGEPDGLARAVEATRADLATLRSWWA